MELVVLVPFYLDFLLNSSKSRESKMFSSWLNSLGERGQTHKKDVIKLNL